MLSNIVPPKLQNISLVATTDQIVGQPLILECSVTTVRGITSRVDIVWSSYGEDLQTINGINAILSDNLTIYRSTFTILLLSTTDDGRVYQCEVVINTSPPVMATGIVTLDVTGMFALNIIDITFNVLYSSYT